MNDFPTLLMQGLQIIGINILLSGDNAVVIALASRGLEESRRKWAIIGGSAVAVILRIIFSIFVVELQKLPYVKLGSGLLLLWIAFELLRGNEEKEVKASASIWGAVRTIALADAIMSLDNVVAVAAAARNSLPLVLFGIAVSVPLIIFGSTMMLKILNRFPILVVGGAALLGWVAGEIMASEKKLAAWIGPLPEHVELYAAGAGAALILLAAGILRWMRGPRDGRPVEVASGPG